MVSVAHDEKRQPGDGGEEKADEISLFEASQEDMECVWALKYKEEGSPSPGEEKETYPKGGLRAWLVVVGSWCGLFSALGLLNSLATFQAYVSMHQLNDESDGKVGWIFSLHTFLTFFCGIYVGPIFDKHGPQWLMLAGSVILFGGLLCLSFSKNFWQFLLSFGGLCGFASTLLFSPSIAAVGHFFKAKRGTATGIAAPGAGLSGVVIPLMMKALFDRVGWGWAVRILALVVLGLCSMADHLIRSRLPPLPGARPHPDIRIFKQVPFLLTTLGIFLVEFGMFVPYTYISSYMLAQGFDDGLSYNSLAILNAGGVVGRVVPGYLSDNIGPFNCNILATLLSAVACLALWLPAGHTTSGMVAFAALIGFASGASIMSSPVCVGKLCKTQEYGRYYATTYTVVSFSCLVSIPIAGAIVQASRGDYWGLIIFTSCMYICGFVFLMAAKISCVGWKRLLSSF